MPRILHKIYAMALGFFWERCPKCGRWFGGHEAAEGVIWNDEQKMSGKMTCCLSYNNSEVKR